MTKKQPVLNYSRYFNDAQGGGHFKFPPEGEGRYNVRMVIFWSWSTTLEICSLKYPIRLRYSEKSSKAYYSSHTTAGKVTICLVWFSVVLLLIFSGVIYRVSASHLQHVIDTPIKLPIPLSAFPERINNWTGSELSIPNTTKDYMKKYFADDFLARRYVNSITRAWADIYILYCSSRPADMLGHRPRVCYPGNGWIHDNTEISHFTSRTGRQIPCLIHRFHKPTLTYEQIVVLNFYVLNGQITTKESDFSGPFSRRPNLAHNPGRYVAQIQISSHLENSARIAAKDMADVILAFFPDENGQVTAAKYNSTIGSIAK